MDRISTLLVLAAAVVLAAGTAAAEGGPGASAGRVLYRTYCASCHGVGGKGDGPVAPVLRTSPADLTLLSERYGTPLRRDELAETIDGRRDVAAHGSREMPVWGERFVDESQDAPNPERQAAEAINRIIDFLATLQPYESAAR